MNFDQRNLISSTIEKQQFIRFQGCQILTLRVAMSGASVSDELGNSKRPGNEPQQLTIATIVSNANF